MVHVDAACFVYTCRRLIDLSNDCRYFYDPEEGEGLASFPSFVPVLPVGARGWRLHGVAAAVIFDKSQDLSDI